MRSRLVILAALVAATPVAAQTPQGTPGGAGAAPGWDVSHAVIPVADPPARQAIRLTSGIAVLTGATIQDGTIDVDIPAPRALGGQFAGVAFRMASTADYEIVYVRAGGDGVRWTDMQYQPVFQGETTWQLYPGDDYEAILPRPADVRAAGGIHLRIVMAGRRADVYVDSMTTPLLRIRELKRDPAPGGVGVWAISPKGAWAEFDRFSVSGEVAVPPAELPPLVTPAGQIMRWGVSERLPAPHDSVTGPAELTDEMRRALAGGTLVDAEATGLLNLTRAVGNPGGPQVSNIFGGAKFGMALASATLTSDRARSVRLRFGYSDGVSIFLNGALLFRGRNDYGYRYRTDIATLNPDADAVVLPLRAGKNELIVAVTDKAFGWGIAARLENAVGVMVAAP